MISCMSNMALKSPLPGAVIRKYFDSNSNYQVLVHGPWATLFLYGKEQIEHTLPSHVLVCLLHECKINKNYLAQVKTTSSMEVKYFPHLNLLHPSKISNFD